MSSSFIKIPWRAWTEMAPSLDAKISLINGFKIPSYGRYLEDFIPGQVFEHPRGITLHEALIQEFSTTFMESCPLFLNRSYPLALGLKDRPVPPLLVLAATLSLGVQNESEKAIAHLGYYDVCFPQMAFAGETLRALTRVLDRKVRGEGEPGIVHVQTLGLNERNEILIRYERKIMIPARPQKSERIYSQTDVHSFPWQDLPILSLPFSITHTVQGWTGGPTFFDDFTVGEIFAHANGRTITDEHLAWTYRLGNTHPLHFDAVYTQALPEPMGGAPVVYGGLVFAWIAGLASRDTTENMIWDLGYTQGYHTQPVRSGDTLYALSRVLKKEESLMPGAGMITLQLIGLKNKSGVQAIEKYGHTLFMKENDKKKLELKKIEDKIFEIERKVMIRKRT